MVASMSDRTEIQKAIEQLPESEVAALFEWLTRKTADAAPHADLEWKNPHASRERIAEWRRGAVGVGIPGVTTESIMRETREG